MATAKAKVLIGGTDLNPYHVHIDQRSDWHHRFEVTISTEKAKLGAVHGKVQEGMVIDTALQKFTGKEAEISIERENGTLNFKGYVTQVRLDQTYAGDSFVILQGYSATYFLDARRSVDSFEEMSLEDIFNKVMADFPANVQQEVNPKYKSPIQYVVRYKETQYQFLSRIAAIYGEWFYYDGQKIVFGELPASNPQVKLTFGSDSMLSFNYGLNLRPSSFKQQFYKYQDNAVIDKSMKSFQPGWLDQHSQISLSESKKLFAEEGLDPVVFDVKDDAQIKHLAEAKKSSIVGDVMVFNGQSANPGVAVGTEVSIDSRTGSFIGNYRVISATHSFNSNRDYTNVFRAIPVSTMAPPFDPTVIMPEAESQVAEVIENNDPEGLGRVRVKFKWQEGKTPWIRVITGYAGGGNSEGVVGMYFTPEVGDEVFVDFEQGNPDRPFVIGSKFHGKIPPEHFDALNNLKAFKTRSGHKLEFDDSDGKEQITMTDKSGNVINIDTKGNNITITANSTITMNATTINLNASESVNIKAGKEYNLETETKSSTVSETTWLQSKSQKTSVEEDSYLIAKEITRNAHDKIEHNSDGTISTKSKDKMTISAQSDIKQNGKGVQITAQKALKLNSSATVDVKAPTIKLN